jgi:hypothetical protein
MDAKGKISPTKLPVYPAHWEDTPLTAVGENPVPLSATQMAVMLGKMAPPPGFVPPK